MRVNTLLCGWVALVLLATLPQAVWAEDTEPKAKKAAVQNKKPPAKAKGAAAAQIKGAAPAQVPAGAAGFTVKANPSFKAGGKGLPVGIVAPQKAVIGGDGKSTGVPSPSGQPKGGLSLPPGFKGADSAAAKDSAPKEAAKDAAKGQAGAAGDKPEKGAKGDKKGPPQMGNMQNERQETSEFKPGVKYYFDFYEADMVEFITQMSEKFKVNFIMSDKVKGGKVTVISPNPITREEAWQTFLSVLNSKDLALVRVGKFYKIISTKDAQKENIKTYLDGGTVDANEEMITYLMKLKYLALSDVDKILKDLKSSNGQILTFEPTGTLIITDTAINIRRMVKILNELDLPSGRDSIHVIDIYYANATDIAEKLQQIFGDKAKNANAKGGKAPAKGASAGDKDDLSSVTMTNVIADDRTNQLIVVAPRDAMPRILDMINRLDVPIPGDGQVHVYYLENANAEELATTLTATAGHAGGGSKSAKGGKGGGKAGGELFEGDVKIQADKATNSLVIIASTKDFNMLKKVIKELDIRRRQVFVEAVIMEVTLKKENQMGLAMNGGYVATIAGQKIPFYAATTLGSLSSLSLDPTALSGMAVGLRGPDLKGTTGMFGNTANLPSFGVILQMLQTDSDANVLSTPHILTMDNEEAEILVGSNVPFITGQARDVNNRPVLSIQRQDVALNMKIKPQINESDFVRLQVQQEVSEIVSISETLGPTTTKRSAKSTVVVKDNQTIVIGGLLRDVQKSDSAKVPLLGDVPLLGRFFRRDSNTAEKTNLLIFLTPHIIKDEEDFKRVFKRKMDERNEFLRKFYGTDKDYDFETDYAQKTGPLESIRSTYETERANEDARKKEEQETMIGPRDGHVAHEVGLVGKERKGGEKAKDAAKDAAKDTPKDKADGDKPETKSDAKADGKNDAKSEAKPGNDIPGVEAPLTTPTRNEAAEAKKAAEQAAAEDDKALAEEMKDAPRKKRAQTPATPEETAKAKQELMDQMLNPAKKSAGATAP